MVSNISYKIRKSKRARRIRLSVYCDGTIVVTLPHRMSEDIVGKFIEKKKNWLISKIDYFKKNRNLRVANFPKGNYAKDKNNALILAKKRVEYFNEMYGYRYNKISIKNQKTRWGSCSKKGNLNFNYRILYLSPQVRDYIIVHELCHLGEFNHSKKFWALVGKAIPNYTEVKKYLRKKHLGF